MVMMMMSTHDRPMIQIIDGERATQLAWMMIAVSAMLTSAVFVVAVLAVITMWIASLI